MIKAMRIITASVTAALLCACSGPIETRVTSVGTENLQPRGYIVAEKPTGASPEYLQAQKLFSDGLAARGFIQQDKADVLMAFTLSDRPASLSVNSGQRVILPKKEQKPLQNCEDRELRVAMQLISIADGAKLYAGEASEYHCKATLAEALPAMVKILIDDIGSAPGDKTTRRAGRD